MSNRKFIIDSCNHIANEDICPACISHNMIVVMADWILDNCHDENECAWQIAYETIKELDRQESEEI